VNAAPERPAPETPLQIWDISEIPNGSPKERRVE